MSSNLVVLSDSQVHDLLIGLSKNDVVKFQQELEKSLLDFAVGNEGRYQLAPDFVNRPNGQKTLFRPFTSPDAVGTKIAVTPAPVEDENGDKVYPAVGGILALCDSSGRPTGILNAAEVTGYRTTLCALIPWMWRRNTENVVIFGAGKQGLWHTRLALALRGSEIKSITIVNRSAARAQSLVKQVEKENEKYWKSSATLAVLEPSQPDYDQRLETLLAETDAVFCTVGSTSPLFSLKAILGKDKRDRLPFVGAIGSWQSDMIELDPEMLRHAAGREDSYSPRGDGGSIMADDLQESLVKSGEVIQSELNAEQILQVGEILSWKQGHFGTEPVGDREKLESWLSEGFVVYKGIGVSTTDLAAGNAILALARERDVGVHIPGF
ncbi:hypothetical protein FZEAL_9333 [Fusarium zealandicum]|uniref:Quinate/shikimate 5-dehydrogenase/glutamyl-tRNA reductase domain-containing protein n=1 Tax=Fusarium zealandicum TaxID=1053134 RepID=A0A8H4XGQ0_9HYPO|nr:hypothetical protein FZEAL_9333 [Fusarium zealandicum]